MIFLEKNKYVILIGDEGAVVTYCKNGVIVDRAFAATSEDHNTVALKKVFEKDTSAPVFFVVDVIDQSYIKQSLPPVSAFGIPKLVNRRLDREFAVDDIKGYILLGKDRASTRGDWECLLVGLANTEQLKGWLSLVDEMPNPFAGIYLVPVESVEFLSNLSKGSRFNHSIGSSIKNALKLDKFKPKVEGKVKSKGKGVKKSLKASTSTWSLLANHSKIGGIRQTITKDGQLVFTRLSQPVDDDKPQVIAGNIEQDIKNTIEYLKRIQFEDDELLDMHIVSSKEIIEHIDKTRIAKNAQVTMHTPFEAAKILGLTDSVKAEDKFGDSLLATFIANKKYFKLMLNTTRTSKLAWLYFSRFYVRYASIFIALLLSVGMIMDSVNLVTLTSISSGLNDEKAEVERSTKIFRDKSGALPENFNEIVDVIDISKVIKENKEDTPFEYVQQLGNAILPKSRVERIFWRLNKNQIISQKNKNSQKSAPKPISFEVELWMKNDVANLEEFMAYANNQLDSLRKSFSGFTISYKNLPGLINANESLNLSFSDTGAGAVSAGSVDYLPGRAVKVIVEFQAKGEV